jgi:hypothetical protein
MQKYNSYIRNKNSRVEIKKIFPTLIITLLFLQVSSVNSETLSHASPTHEIIVAVNVDVIKEIAEFKTGSCLQPDDFLLYSGKKHLLTLNIFCRALTAANYDFTLKIISVPNVTRAKWMISKGEAHVFMHLLKKKHFDSVVYSDVVKRDEKRLSAFFTTMHNHTALAAQSLSDIQKLKAAVPQRWPWQHKKLEKLKVNYHKVLYKHIFEFIEKQRADVILLDMKGKNPTERTLFGVKLKATGQIYFTGKQNSEHFLLSKNIKGADEFITALNSGLKKLNESGVIDKVFAGLAIDESQLVGWKKIPFSL